MILLEITLGCTSDSLSVYDGLDGEDIERRIVELCGEHENIKVRNIYLLLFDIRKRINQQWLLLHTSLLLQTSLSVYYITEEIR